MTVCLPQQLLPPVEGVSIFAVGSIAALEQAANGANVAVDLDKLYRADESAAEWKAAVVQL